MMIFMDERKVNAIVGLCLYIYIYIKEVDKIMENVRNPGIEFVLVTLK